MVQRRVCRRPLPARSWGKRVCRIRLRVGARHGASAPKPRQGGAAVLFSFVAASDRSARKQREGARQGGVFDMRALLPSPAQACAGTRPVRLGASSRTTPHPANERPRGEQAERSDGREPSTPRYHIRFAMANAGEAAGREAARRGRICEFWRACDRVMAEVTAHD